VYYFPIVLCQSATKALVQPGIALQNLLVAVDKQVLAQMFERKAMTVISQNRLVLRKGTLHIAADHCSEYEQADFLRREVIPFNSGLRHSLKHVGNLPMRAQSTVLQQNAFQLVVNGLRNDACNAS